ncbi:hypothetical protein MNBD_CHLOROFLEXI01-1437 [hydrothermal vent metagenome]|uniref:Uncharacterized protein n=1 Tax=hydrothermal vent metagenome TaxID=652676 RepID=A0A3B0VVJ7_9ZZZZ
MKSPQTSTSGHFNHQINRQALPNVDMLSRQIENLRIVMRRMKTVESSSLDLLINQKLKELQN